MAGARATVQRTSAAGLAQQRALHLAVGRLGKLSTQRRWRGRAKRGSVAYGLRRRRHGRVADEGQHQLVLAARDVAGHCLRGDFGHAGRAAEKALDFAAQDVLITAADAVLQPVDEALHAGVAGVEP